MTSFIFQRWEVVVLCRFSSIYQVVTCDIELSCPGPWNSLEPHVGTFDCCIKYSSFLDRPYNNDILFLFGLKRPLCGTWIPFDSIDNCLSTVLIAPCACSDPTWSDHGSHELLCLPCRFVMLQWRMDVASLWFDWPSRALKPVTRSQHDFSQRLVDAIVLLGLLAISDYSIHLIRSVQAGRVSGTQLLMDDYTWSVKRIIIMCCVRTSLWPCCMRRMSWCIMLWCCWWQMLVT
jgi:hypothetical protein